MKILPFEPQHMIDLLPRINMSQSLDAERWTADFCAQAQETCTLYTAMADDGRVMAVCGAMRIWEGRHHLFAYMARDSGPYMVPITRGVRRFLATLSGRVEAQISDGFGAGTRWVKILGLKCETPNGMDAFFPGGHKAFMYAKVLS